MPYIVTTNGTMDDYKRPDTWAGSSQYDTKEDALKAACLIYLTHIEDYERWDDMDSADAESIVEERWADFLDAMEESNLFQGEYVPRTLTVTVSGGGGKTLSKDQKEELVRFKKNCQGVLDEKNKEN
jgi:hypothetical protein